MAIAPMLSGMALETLLEEPQLRPYLPLLYLAWADGSLEDDERALIEARLDAQPWLEPRLREALHAWMQAAPSARQLAKLRGAIERVVGTLSPQSQRSLRAIAESMAALDPDSASWMTELEQRLGLSADALSRPAAHAIDNPYRVARRFDPGQLQLFLDGRFGEARAAARAFLAEPAHRAQYGVAQAQRREQVLAWLGELAARGMGALAYPGVTCAREQGLGPFLATFEALGYGDLSLVVKYGVQFGLWGGSVYFLGDDAQRQAWLPKIANLEALGCFAMSEVGHGSNVADLETLVRWEPARDGFVLHTPSESARKDWAGNAAEHGRYATVFAQLEVGDERHGVHAFLVPIRDEQGQPLPGIRLGDCGPKAGLHGVDNGRLWFDQVLLPRDALLGRYASIDAAGTYQSPIESPNKRFFTMLGTLVGGRLGVAAAGLSAAKLGLSIALRYATERRQFGPTAQPETLLLDYPSHRRRLLPQLAASYAYHFALDQVREQFLALGADEDRREIEAEVAGLKAQSTWHARDCLQLARECCGGQGYLAVNRLADARADVDIFTTFEGDNTVLRQLLAKGLLTGFRKQLSEQGPVRVIASQLAQTARLSNPLTRRVSSAETLRSAEHQLEILRHREASLLQSAAQRMQKRAAAKTEGQRALIEVQEHLLALAEAHVDARTLAAFIDAVARAPEPLRPALDRLRTLHGLCVLERHSAWLLENGVFESQKARAVRKLVPELFEELTADVLPLTEAFGIPDACLAAPIAFNDPAHPRW